MPSEPEHVCSACGEDESLVSVEGEYFCPDCIHDNTNECGGCYQDFNTDNMRTDYRNRTYCNGCYEALVRQCEDCGCEVNIRHDEYHDDMGVICTSCYNDRMVECNNCGEDINAGEVITTRNGNTFCGDCYHDSFVTCSDCGEEVPRDQARQTRNRMYCANCDRHDEWDDNGFYQENPTYTELRSRRKFGIEIETSACPDHPSIREDTVFGCKPDGSIDGMEFVSPVLYGDEGLEAIRTLCGHARRLNWEVDSSCGLHAHFDLSNESSEQLYNVARAYGYTYEFWTRFVSNARKSNYYCAEHIYNDGGMVGAGEFRRWANSATEKYTWVNWQTYNRIKTVELRVHSATLNPTKIINWVKAHARFIDKVVTMSEAEVQRALAGRSVYDQFNTIAGWWDDNELKQFYLERAQGFGKPIRSTRTLVTA